MQKGLTPRFVREARLSTAVHDPNVIETTPEDDRPFSAAAGFPCERYLCTLLYALLLFLILNLIGLLYCWLKKRKNKDLQGVVFLSARRHTSGMPSVEKYAATHEIEIFTTPS
ncbi:MAG: hypothetical protein PHI97_01425 [Desulfobulbus sp.]|nr:hypothetical protein [Desulfobulbus sp.]